MSEFYYRKQRKEDIASLQAMFGPPWTEKLLGQVLDYYDGNVDEAVHKLLVLESHHNGNPEPLVDRLILSGLRTQRAPPAFAGAAATSMAAIPKSKLKKAPPPRKVKVDVITADGGSSATITIHKTTRRRVGIPMKLPDDFLRVPKRPQKPKTPLFNPETLNQLIFDMPSGPLYQDPLSAPPDAAAKSGPASNFQALRASINFPSFPKSAPETTASNNDDTQKRRFFLPGRAYSHDPSTDTSGPSLMSKFSVPKNLMSSAPAMSMPKLHFPGRAETNNAPPPKSPPLNAFDHSNTAAMSSADLFSKPHDDGRWGLQMPALGGTKAQARAPPPGGGNNSNINRWGLPSFAKVNTAEQQTTQEHASAATGTTRWSMPAVIGSSLQLSNIGSRIGSSVVHDDVQHHHNPTVDIYGPIPLEFRGINVQQLQQLVHEMQHRCLQEEWKSVETGQILQPSEVTMYDLVKYLVIPKTQARCCSYIEQAFGKHYHEHGLSRPPKWFVSHTWSDSVLDLVQCIEQHAVDRGYATSSDNKHCAMYWICALAMNQHAVGATKDVVADLDRLSDDSLLQDPRLTQKVLQGTEGMLAVIDRKDTFFSRIWCLWEVFLALERAKASVGVVDAVTGELEDQYLLDVYAMNEQGAPVGLTFGATEADKFRLSKTEGKDNTIGSSTSGLFKPHPCNQSEWSELRAVRQSHFRFQSCQAALDLNLESTHASLEEDTRRIMNYIVQNKRDDNPNEAEALTAHPAYAYVNTLIHGTFAGMAYRRALEDCSVGEEKKDELDRVSLKKVQAALLASPITNLEVSFAGCTSFQIREALKFVESLPTSLQRVDLDYSFLDFQYAEEFAIGLSRLRENLQTFKLSLSFCSRLDNLDRLWEELGNLVNLRCLVLVIHPNKGVTSVDGLATALSKMPHLESLQLEFDCFGEYSKLVAMAKGGATLHNISSTCRSMLGGKSSDFSNRRRQELSQQFDKVAKLSNLDLGGAYISDSSIQRLCWSLLASRNLNGAKLALLKLRFLGDFGKKLRNVENIENLQKTLERIRNGLKLFS